MFFTPAPHFAGIPCYLISKGVWSLKIWSLDILEEEWEAVRDVVGQPFKRRQTRAGLNKTSSFADPKSKESWTLKHN